MTPFLRLLATVLLALAVGFFAGVRAAASFTPSHHRWMAPPVPANLAFRPFPSPIVLYESPTTSSGASTPVAAPASPVGVVTTAQAGGAQGRQPLTGVATWYAGPDCLCAAAGPDLRHGDWRGSTVTVNGLAVRLIDWCACGPRNGLPTLLDLSIEAVAALGLDPRRGVYAVEVTP